MGLDPDSDLSRFDIGEPPRPHWAESLIAWVIMIGCFIAILYNL